MKIKLTFLIIFSIFISSSFAQKKAEKQSTSIYFRGGKILAAEIKDKKPDIKNVSEYEPPSKITKNVGWAAVVVKLDKGRTIGIYDYVLKNKKGKLFPCVAVREMAGQFDVSNWRFENTDPKKLYTMVFKVEKPNMGKAEYDLHFNLPVGKSKDIKLEFKKVDNYTSPKSISDKDTAKVNTEKTSKTNTTNKK